MSTSAESAVTSDFISSVENVDEVTRKISVKVPVDIVQGKVNKLLSRATAKATVNGFRPGKAPRSLVEKLYGDSVRRDVLNDLLQETYSKVLEKEKLEVVGNPEIDLTGFDANKDFEYTAKVSIFPAPVIIGYDTIKVKVQKRSVATQEVEAEIEKLRRSQATMKQIEGRTTAAKGDVVELEVAEMNGDKPGRPEPIMTELGEKKLPEHVEAQIAGLEISAFKDVEWEPSAPDAAPTKKQIVRLTLKGLHTRVLPELSDAFVSELKQEGITTVETLKTDVQKKLEEKAAADIKADTQIAIVNAVVAKNAFQVPQPLIDNELRALMARSGLMDEKKAQSVDIEPFRAGLTDVALKRVKGAIIVDRIGEAEKIKAEKDDIDKEIKSLAERSGVDEEAARSYVFHQDRFVGFVMEITRTKVMNFLMDRAEIEFVEKVEEA